MKALPPKPTVVLCIIVYNYARQDLGPGEGGGKGAGEFDTIRIRENGVNVVIETRVFAQETPDWVADSLLTE